MPRDSTSLRSDALRIWQAGLEAVRSERLMREHVRVESRKLTISDIYGDSQTVDLDAVGRIAVVGTGKAGAGMAAALEEILGPALREEKQLSGWINVPADCVRPLQCIHLHAARPAGQNIPTAEGVAGSEEILRLVSSLGPNDLCLVLVSGGGSALLPAPIDGISLADKLAVTKFMSAAGADIAELNTVRKQLSRIKGGGLARACRAGRLIALVISDIPGDPLDLISSGPTVRDSSTPQDALDILQRHQALQGKVPELVFEVLSRRADSQSVPRQFPCDVQNVLIGNNATAVDAAGQEAVRLGYQPAMICACDPEGAVEKIGSKLAQAAVNMRKGGLNCLINGGEGTVKLAPEVERGLGGRNQQTVLAALQNLIERNSANDASPLSGVVILSAGTDGEDGPTDAAGAVIDSQVLAEARHRGLDGADYLRRNDAYHFFEPLGALIKTGPTHTNVCDVRVVLVQREAGG